MADDYEDGMTEEERIRILEEKTDDNKLSHLIRSAVQECLDTSSNMSNVKTISENRISKIERDLIAVQSDLVSIQEETLRLARRNLDNIKSVNKFDKDLSDLDFKLTIISEGAKELRDLASNTADDLRKLATKNAEDLKQLAEDKAKNLEDLAEHRATDLKEDEVIGWNRRQQMVATLIVIVSVIISAVSLFKR
jgi:hypothetical protein